MIEEIKLPTVRNKLIHTGLFSLITLICICVCIVVFYGVKALESYSVAPKQPELSHISQKFLEKEGELLGRMLKQGGNIQQLHQKIAELVEKPFIQEAKLYSASGNLLTEASKQGVKNEKTQSLQNELKIIYADYTVQGFLEIQKNTNLKKLAEQQRDNIFLRFYALQIILFLLGTAFGIGVYRLYKHLLTSSLPQSEKSTF